MLLAVTLEVFPINSFVPVKILTVMLADFPQNTARVSDSDNICRNILHNHTACTNDGIVPDCNTGNNHDAGSDPDIFPDVHVLIILQTLFPQLRQDRVIGSCNGHIGAEHDVISDIDVSIIYQGQIKIGVNIVSHIDMFWTKHEDAVKHSLLRAISGGPIYVSDQIGDTNPDVLKPLVYHNGEILMMDHSAKPTEDCMFSDPMKTGVLKLHNTASWGSVKKGGGIAVYNLTDGIQDFSFRPADIPQLEESDNYWVYDYFAKNAFSLGKQESYESRLDLGGFGWFVLLPKGKYGTCLGLLDKFVGFTAVESIFENDSTQTVVVKESGTLGWLSEKEPQKVMVNSVDVTSSVKKNDFLYEITLPEGPHKTVLSFVW